MAGWGGVGYSGEVRWDGSPVGRGIAMCSFGSVFLLITTVDYARTSSAQLALRKMSLRVERSMGSYPFRKAFF